jgi:Zn-dependent protease
MALSNIPGPVWSAASLLMSLAYYGCRLGWGLAAGFLVLLSVHETGHLLAARRYRLRTSWPLFVPGLGALIDIQEAPGDRWQNAVIGVSGPVFGTVGTLACWVLAHVSGCRLLYEAAFAGAVMNTFNLIPVGPMDGGRVAELFSRWLWIPGYVMLAAFVWFFHAPSAILMLVVMLPMVLSLFRGRSRKSDSSDLREQSRVSLGKRLAMGFLYIGLVIILASSMCWIFVKDIAPRLHAGKSLTHSIPGNKTAGVDH